MLQQDEPGDFVLATGVASTVGRFVDESFQTAGLDYREYVEVDPSYYRPTEVDHLLGDPSKALAILGWKAQTHWGELARLMTHADMAALDRQLAGHVPPQR